MDKREMDYETRKQRALHRLGTDNPRCRICGNDRWECLELHHLEGQAYGDTLVIVCRNCHRELSVQQDGHPKPLPGGRTTGECIGHFMLGLADLLVLLAKKLKELGEWLIEEARRALPKKRRASP